MNASAAEPWARLGIVQGQSPRDRWELASTRGPAMIVVGSSSSCSWVVQGAGVAPLHFSLYWDGRTLRISRSPGAPEVHVDGEVVWHAWRVLGGPARIQFGEAAIMVETSAGVAAQANAQATPQPTPAPATRQATPPSAASPALENAAPTPTLAAPSTAARAPEAGASTPVARVPAGAAPTPARAPVSAAPTPARAPVSAAPTPAAQPATSPAVSERTRAPKQTLLGMAYVSTPPPGASGPAPAAASSAQPPATSPEAGRPSTPAAARETLPGPGATPRRTGSLAAGDQRTMQGYSTPHPQPPVTVSVGGSISSVPPARRDTLRDATRPDGTRPTPAPGRPISDRPLATSLPRTWEAPSPSYEDDGAPTEVMDISAAAPHAMQVREPLPPEDPHRAQPIPMPPSPAELRGVTAPISHRPRRPFPWQYVLVGALTVVAYFAWLYLLDHF